LPTNPQRQEGLVCPGLGWIRSTTSLMMMMVEKIDDALVPSPKQEEES